MSYISYNIIAVELYILYSRQAKVHDMIAVLN